MSDIKESTGNSRRDFLRKSGMGGAALWLGVAFPASAGIVNIFSSDDPEASTIEMNAWIHIATDGKVTLFDHRSEMGQGSYHSVPQIIAEELEVDLKDINVVFAQGNSKKYGSQITGGSSTIRGSYKNLLKLSATAREMLIAAAAAKWKVGASECYAQSGNVINRKTGKKFHYGELVVAASKLSAPKELKLKKVSEYKLIRKPLKRIDTPLKTNGVAVFGIDKRLPGLLFAAVERNPRLRGKVKSFDDSAALKVPGVKKVVKVVMKVHETNREGVAVIATSTYASFQGKKALKVEWDDSGFEHVNTAAIYNRQAELLSSQEGITHTNNGNADAAISKAANVIDVVYETPYQSHYCMEPVNCTAHYQADKIEVWGPIQAPDWIQGNISQLTGMAPEKVIVNMTFLGGGFGRKAFTDFPQEAVLLSKEMNAPVQVVWTREDDATQGPYRPGITYRCQGVLSDGKIEAAKFRLAGQNIGHWSNPDRTKPNDSADEGFLKPYQKAIKNFKIADVPFETPIPVLWWRSVYASTNGFAFESFIDEMAVAAKKDPLEFRREHLPDERLGKLIDRLEEMSGWKNRKPNEGFGVAITECFDSFVGQIVKVSKNPAGGVKIDKVWAVMDCGWYVNPDIIHAQVEGSVVMALGAATMHEITFTDGMVNQKNFYDYQMPRITDIPPIEVVVMDNDHDAGGVGEPGLPPFTPALTNAIFDLTGKRIRKLPFNMASV